MSCRLLFDEQSITTVGNIADRTNTGIKRVRASSIIIIIIIILYSVGKADIWDTRRQSTHTLTDVAATGVIHLTREIVVAKKCARAKNSINICFFLDGLQ